MMSSQPLVKYTIIIWAPKEYLNSDIGLSDLGREADSGECYASRVKSELINNPRSDPDWDGTEFFDPPEVEGA